MKIHKYACSSCSSSAFFRVVPETVNQGACALFIHYLCIQRIHCAPLANNNNKCFYSSRKGLDIF